MFVNLTKHEINVVSPSGEAVLNIPSSGTEARVAIQRRPAGTHMGVQMYSPTPGEIVNLPEPEKDTIYIVSGQIRSALPHRTDLASPGNLVRDENGRVIGCEGLDRNL